MKDFDVVVVGASFAGIACAREMATRGLSVAVLERKRDVRENLQTTGVLVDEAASLLELPPHLYREISKVRLYSASLDYLTLVSEKYLFLATDTPALFEHLVEDARQRGVQFFFATPFDHAVTDHAGIIINGAYHCRMVVGADGAKSKVAEVFHLGRNETFLIGTEFEYEGVEMDNPDAFYCFLNRRLAPGYIGWAIPGPRVVQLGVARLFSSRKQSRPDIEGFISHIEKELRLNNPKVVEKRGGLIPIGGVVKPFYNNHAVLVGDAAGLVSPLTAGGIHTALFYGRRLGELTYRHLREAHPHPGPILEKEYPRFRHKQIYRRIFNSMPDWCFNLLLRLPGFRTFAHALFFLKKHLPKSAQRAMKKRPD